MTATLEGSTAETTGHAVRLSGVHKSFGTGRDAVAALAGVDLDVSPGEFVYRSSGLFRDKGIRQIATPPGMVNPYYARLGFREQGDHWVADLI